MNDSSLSEIKVIRKQFIDDLEKLVLENSCSYIEGVVLLCERKKIDIEAAALYINTDKLVKSKIQFEAENLNFLKKGARLPI